MDISVQKSAYPDPGIKPPLEAGLSLSKVGHQHLLSDLKIVQRMENKAKSAKIHLPTHGEFCLKKGSKGGQKKLK